MLSSNNSRCDCTCHCRRRVTYKAPILRARLPDLITHTHTPNNGMFKKKRLAARMWLSACPALQSLAGRALMFRAPKTYSSSLDVRLSTRSLLQYSKSDGVRIAYLPALKHSPPRSMISGAVRSRSTSLDKSSPQLTSVLLATYSAGKKPLHRTLMSQAFVFRRSYRRCS